MLRNFVEIHFSRLLENLTFLQTKQPNQACILMLKGNAYGHGLCEVGLYLESHLEHPSVPIYLGVATLEEGEQLRLAGVRIPILVFSGFFHSSHVERCRTQALEPVLNAIEQYHLWQPKCECWIYLNTGMNQLGMSVGDLSELDPNLTVNLITHFSESEVEDSAFTQAQLAHFSEVVSTSNLKFRYISAYNSMACLGLEPNANCNMFRTGLGLYTASRPVMHFYSRVMAIREIEPGDYVGYNRRFQSSQHMKIATIAVGYADGYPQHAPDGMPVWIRGTRCPLLGKVSMDVMVVDVSHLSEVCVGDLVELWGDHLSIFEVAEAMSFSPYSLMTQVSVRVPRISDSEF